MGEGEKERGGEGIPDIFLSCHPTKCHFKKIPDTASRTDFLRCGDALIGTLRGCPELIIRP